MSSPRKLTRSGTRGYAHLVEVAVPVARVWRTLTDPALVRIWSGQEAEIDPRENGLYRIGRRGAGGRRERYRPGQAPAEGLRDLVHRHRGGQVLHRRADPVGHLLELGGVEAEELDGRRAEDPPDVVLGRLDHLVACLSPVLH